MNIIGNEIMQTMHYGETWDSKTSPTIDTPINCLQTKLALATTERSLQKLCPFPAKLDHLFKIIGHDEPTRKENDFPFLSKKKAPPLNHRPG